VCLPGTDTRPVVPLRPLVACIRLWCRRKRACGYSAAGAARGTREGQKQSGGVYATSHGACGDDIKGSGGDGGAQQGLRVHASSQGTQAAAGAPHSEHEVHASSQGTQAAAGAPHCQHEVHASSQGTQASAGAAHCEHKVHASSQGIQAAAGAARCSHGGAQQGLRMHASSQGTRAAAGAARSDSDGLKQGLRVHELAGYPHRCRGALQSP